MTLRDYFIARGWVRNGSNKCLCPFHNDRSASAILNNNSIFCFTCGTLYTLWDFNQAFGVFLDRVDEEDSACLGAIKGNPTYQPNQVLFCYPFSVSEL